MCGEAEGGKLGKGDMSNPIRTPSVVNGIQGRAVKVACGGSQTVVVTGVCLIKIM